MNAPHKITSEVFHILKKKKDEKELQHRNAENKKQQNLKKIEELYKETQSWFHHLKDMGVKHETVTQIKTIDFGAGEENIEIKTQIFSLEDIGNILVLTPNFCDNTQNPLQFSAILPNSKSATLIFWPQPHTLKLPPKWHTFENGSNSLVESSYTEFNEELVMTLLKNRISD